MQWGSSDDATEYITQGRLCVPSSAQRLSYPPATTFPVRAQSTISGPQPQHHAVGSRWTESRIWCEVYRSATHRGRGDISQGDGIRCEKLLYAWMPPSFAYDDVVRGVELNSAKCVICGYILSIEWWILSLPSLLLFVNVILRRMAFGLPPHLSASEHFDYSTLQELCTSYDLLTDDLYIMDILNYTDDCRYFVFEVRLNICDAKVCVWVMWYRKNCAKFCFVFLATVLFKTKHNISSTSHCLASFTTPINTIMTLLQRHLMLCCHLWV